MKWRGKLNLKTEKECWHKLLCCRWPNKVSCKNHSNTPGISMHTFPQEAKRKQKWTTFARIHMHRLACQLNTLHCAPSILKHCVSPVDFKRFYLKNGSIPSIYMKPKGSLDTDTFFGCFFGTLPKVLVSKIPPQKKNRLGRFQDDRSTTLSMMMGLF